jgi:predicted O-linked N-acetylglucosamine transferase (SPINDLY family)
MPSRDVRAAGRELELGNALGRRGRWAAAIRHYERALAADPGFALAYFNRGVGLQALGRSEAALESYDLALARDRSLASAWFNRGVLLRQLGRSDDALGSYAESVAIKPDYVAAHYNRATLLLELGRAEEALEGFDAALGLEPRLTEAWLNRGNALRALQQLEAAQQSYERCVALDAGYADAHFNLGNLFAERRQFTRAVASFDLAIAAAPTHADALLNRGNALASLRRYAEALQSYAAALALRPRLDFALGQQRAVKMQLCDWEGFDADLEELRRRAGCGEAASPPFAFLALCGAPGLQKRVAETWVRKKYPGQSRDSSLGPATLRGEMRDDKIRLGYFSADLRDHPVGWLAAEVFEAHERRHFETTAFAFGPEGRDPMRLRLEHAFDRFIDVGDRSDADVVRLARSLKIDIAIDLGGYTEGCRPEIFSLRAAPLQVGYLGYLGTLGGPLDYLLADAVLVPPELREHYTEKLLYLPSYQANGRVRPMATRRYTRRELGLPDSGCVFCCFNSIYKLNPDTFDSWCRILQRAAGSVLWLYAGSAEAEARLASAARARGIDPRRLIFAEWLPTDLHLARCAAADLFLDTDPYNAGTTASDALWAGLPLLTLQGASFAGRMAASVLTAAGLPGLIAATRRDYEDTAVGLAAAPVRLAALKADVAGRVRDTRLYDSLRFTRTLEAAFQRIHARHLAGEPPDHCVVDAG